MSNQEKVTELGLLTFAGCIVFLAVILHNWKAADAFPKMKSTVPEMVHSLYK
jgi:hypothetical protein